MSVENTCPSCGHRAPGEEPLARAVFRCDECGSHIAFGTLIPRTSLLPSADGRFYTLRFALGATVSEFTLDAWTLGMLAANAASVLPRS